MSWAACAIAHYADDMGRYCENAQAWMDVAQADLESRGLGERREKILDIKTAGDLLSQCGLSVEFDINDMDKQLAVLALAIATGTRFEFPGGKPANGWIGYMLRANEAGYNLDLSEHLTRPELFSLQCNT